MWYNSNVYVIKTPDIEKLRLFLQNFGLTFVKEQHGNGPEHYACEADGKVLEIYPSHSLPQKEVSDGAT